jgi:hypothetical protein
MQKVPPSEKLRKEIEEILAGQVREDEDALGLLIERSLKKWCFRGYWNRKYGIIWGGITTSEELGTGKGTETGMSRSG